jgi:hypothetical protein
MLIKVARYSFQKQVYNSLTVLDVVFLSFMQLISWADIGMYIYFKIKEYRMVFRAGLRDPCTRDVARLSESVKILEPQASVFLRFPKAEHF